MTTTREGEYLVHAEAKLDGFSSKVMSKQGEDGSMYYFHILRNEFTKGHGLLEHRFTHGSSVMQVIKHQDGNYFKYSSREESDLHEYVKNHRAAVDLYLDLKGLGMTSVERLRVILPTSNHRGYLRVPLNHKHPLAWLSGAGRGNYENQD